MLDAFIVLLCLELCSHNRRIPNDVSTEEAVGVAVPDACLSTGSGDNYENERKKER